MHVDLYDHEAAAPVLDSVAFYKNCRALLTDEGTMTVNLFGRTSSYEKSLAKMAEAFGEDALWAFKPTREGNTVVMAQRTASRPKRDQLQLQAEAIENRFGLPATKWLKVCVAIGLAVTVMTFATACSEGLPMVFSKAVIFA